MKLPNQSEAVNRTIGVVASSVEASQPFSRVSFPSRNDAFLLDRGPRAVFATLDVKCGKTTYTVSTGSNDGFCNTTTKNGKTTGGGCADSKGNDAFVDCDFNKGEGVCDRVNGSGSCSMKMVS